MSWLWVPAAGLAVAVVLLARRLGQTRRLTDRVGARVAAVLESRETGMSVWVDDRLVACNQRFREFYPSVTLKPGLVREDLIRFMATRGVVRLPDAEIESWVEARMGAWRERSRETVRRADGGWLEVESVPTSRDELLILLADVTATHNAQMELSERVARLEQQSTARGLLQRVIEVTGTARSFEAAVAPVIDELCVWTGWPVGYALRVLPDGRGPEPMGIWRVTQDDPPTTTATALAAAVDVGGAAAAGRAVRSSRIVWVGNVAVDPEVPHQLRDAMPALCGVCAVPVRRGGRVQVVLEFLATEPLVSDPRTTEVLQAAATALGSVAEPIETQGDG